MLELNGETLVIRGPARVLIKDGDLEILGRRCSPGESVVIPKGKSLILSGRGIIEILGKPEGIQKCERSVPESWERALDILLDKGKGSVAIALGAIDTGKTTLVWYLANQLACRGYRVGIVDSDIGQADIGPPGIVSLGILDEPVSSLSDVEMIAGYFIGSKSPPGHLLQLVVGTKRMVDRALDLECDFVLIDTTGLIHDGIGRALKRAKVEAIDPDLVMILDRGGESAHLLELLSPSYHVVKLEVSRLVDEKEREERILLRKRSFERYFKDLREIELDLGKVRLLGSLIGTGRPERIENSVYAEISPDCAVIIAEKGRKKIFLDMLRDLKERYGRVKILEEGFEKNLYVGILDERMNLIGFGIILEANFREKKLKLLARFLRGRGLDEVRYLQLGYLRLSEKGEELSTLPPGYI